MSESANIPVSMRDADGVAVITMDDGKANALSFPMIELLEQTFTAAAESARAIVLAGRPGLFCGGLDLKVMRGDDPVAVQRMITRSEDLLEQIATTPIPVVAACTGHAIAGGTMLLLAADYRIGALDESIKIGLTESTVGIPMPDFAQQFAVARLDRRFLLRATALAEVVTPARAVEWGYLDETAPAADLVERAIEVAARLRDNVQQAAYAYTKGLVLRKRRTTHTNG